MSEQIRPGLLAALLVVVAVCPVAVSAQGANSAVHLPDGEPKAFIEGACMACHRLDSALWIADGFDRAEEKVLSKWIQSYLAIQPPVYPEDRSPGKCFE